MSLRTPLLDNDVFNSGPRRLLSMSKVQGRPWQKVADAWRRRDAPMPTSSKPTSSNVFVKQ